MTIYTVISYDDTKPCAERRTGYQKFATGRAAHRSAGRAVRTNGTTRVSVFKGAGFDFRPHAQYRRTGETVTREDAS